MNTEQVGFMQGRLSPLQDGKIQAFPWANWQQEFSTAGDAGFQLMEWTLDQEDLYQNPIMTHQGRQDVKRLMTIHGISIKSLTGDCFMQAPFFKANLGTRQKLEGDLDAVIEACSDVGVEYIVFPLVDNGSLESLTQRDVLIDTMLERAGRLKQKGVTIVFESDLGPQELAQFIEVFPSHVFGINYDMGNSAALGFDAFEELDAYGSRVRNVHVKDRVRNGGTVPLGDGATDFDACFLALASHQYKGNYILQTARAEDNDHLKVLLKYFTMTSSWVQKYGSCIEG